MLVECPQASRMARTLEYQWVHVIASRRSEHIDNLHTPAFFQKYTIYNVIQHQTPTVAQRNT